jgi:hypothetical protein
LDITIFRARLEINKNIADIVAPELENLHFEVIDKNLSVSEIRLDDEKLVVCKNIEKIRDDKVYREHQIEKGKRIIDKVKRRVKSGRLVMRDKIFKTLVKKLAQKKVDHYFDLESIP